VQRHQHLVRPAIVLFRRTSIERLPAEEERLIELNRIQVVEALVWWWLGTIGVAMRLNAISIDNRATEELGFYNNHQV
jgi:hypothetical protein